MRKVICLFVCVCAFSPVFAQRTLTIDSCRALAVRNNKELRIAQQKIDVATLTRKAAFTHFLPKLDVLGSYTRSEKEISLLSGEQRELLPQMGTQMATSLQPQMAKLQAVAAANPTMAPVLQPLLGMAQNIAGGINAMGNRLADALRTDTRNLFVATATLTQPIFMGGKIMAYHRMARLGEQVARLQYKKGTQDLLVSVDEAYWQVVSLQHKEQLARQYLDLVKKLDGDVAKMVDEGLATKADALSVRVKVNEAEVALLKVTDGVALSKMVLCQLCGIPLGSDIRPADTDLPVPAVGTVDTAERVAVALKNRNELQMLQLATDVYRQKTRVARAALMPEVAFTANYLVSNPSLYNGFEKRFNGMWTAGIVVRIPVFHWGEDAYKFRAAKAEARIARYQLEEAREKVELQVTQNAYKMAEADKKVVMTRQNVEKAQENLRYANLGFSEGVISSTQVLEAQTAWMAAESDALDALINRRMAEVYLNQSLGILN